MFFELSSYITIGKYRFDRINEVTIVEDLESIGTKATIKVPHTAKLKRTGGEITEVETAKTFAVGDKVVIQLGYDGNLKTEFEGYVKNIQIGTPLSIECEDGLFHLKRKNLKKAFKSVSLKTLLHYILEGTGIGLANEPPTIVFEKFYLRDVSAAAALEKLKSEYGLTITTIGLTKLYVGLYSPVDTTVVKYAFGVNIIDSDLEFVREEDVQLEIKAVHIRKNNTKVEKTIGDKGGERRTLYFYNLPAGSDLETVAREEMKRLKYTGFKGKFKTFLIPHIHAGNVAFLDDEQYSERIGKYLVKKMELIFGTGGARRNVEIGLKVSE